MKRLVREIAFLYEYDEVGAGWPAVPSVCGWASDHSFMAPQIERLSRFYRAIPRDLCGHGRNGAQHRPLSTACSAIAKPPRIKFMEKSDENKEFGSSS